jgi:hypothetical protein
MHAAHAAPDLHQPAAGRRMRPAYVQQQVGHTDPTLTLRIYQQLLKRKRREEYRARVNDLLGTSPAALSRLPEPAQDGALDPNLDPTRSSGRPDQV